MKIPSYSTGTIYIYIVLVQNYIFMEQIPKPKPIPKAYFSVLFMPYSKWYTGHILKISMFYYYWKLTYYTEQSSGVVTSVVSDTEVKYSTVHFNTVQESWVVLYEILKYRVQYFLLCTPPSRA